MTEQHILDQLERVVEKEYIFGVRHHSPACAHAVVQAAEALQPEAIAVEMPADTKPMLPWIVHDDTKAPIALAVAAENTQLGFYPFADFSPELAIMFPSTSSTCRSAHPRPQAPTNQQLPMRTHSHPST